ncbi:MAG: hypothetical protein WAL22_14260 [Solirubrobacteraceae bacterium]
MTAAETASDLACFTGRRGGSDAERRAALWLSDRLRSQGRAATIETFWCRPNWALAHAWHAILGLGATVLIVSQPRIGGGLALVAVASIAFDAATGRSLGRRFTPERASQNVVAPDPAEAPDAARLIVTANYDAGRTGLVYRTGPRMLAATLRRAAAGGRLTPGWLGWLTIALLWLVVIAIVRNGGTSGTPIDVLQLVPSIGLLAAAVALLELSLSATSPGASDNAAGVAVALATIAALDGRPDAHPARGVAVDLVLQGASDGDGTGLRRYLRRSRHARPFVIGIAACGSGSPHWWRSDGSLWPLRYDRRLTELAAGAAPSTDGSPAESTVGSPSGHRGRGIAPALTARATGLPAISIGCVDEHGLAPRSHRLTDVVDALEPGSLEATAHFAVELITAIERSARPAVTA